ncbi:MAG: transporter substrate-binding domain-containing protein [Candidatus Omnitrophica bacterium]|nr:transporter substrate-binding domain-containing protein [Candidatus Omnitrophota bacterium]
MPYNGDPASVKPGYCVELIKAIFEPAGYTVDYQIQPWARDIAEVKEGNIDAVIGADSGDCPLCLFPKQAIGVNQNFYYVKKGNPWVFNGLKSLNLLRLGVIDSYSYDSGALDAYIKTADTQYVQKAAGDTALEVNIQKLQADRLDAIVENNWVLKNALKNLAIPEEAIVAAGKASEPQEVFLAFAPGKESSAKYTSLWDAGIQQLRASGKLKSILDKYHLADWKIAAP